ncbi:TPA: hypothetical protein N0F65_011791 [Lagenidium giganteum]|uniref:Uncharacterized protein n=1 Tax=Lagenidium giganteum TaxID=4803 RepID=A0AAV2YTL1_9STRA|nr:TPA: hypothetical protein N0F65_011791 [Lagenidium giganteum]
MELERDNNHEDEREQLKGSPVTSHKVAPVAATASSPTTARCHSPTEKFLRTKLAEVLLELSREKENLQLAASAGKSLLEQLSACQEEKHALRDEMDSRQGELEFAERENQRLKQMCAAMEDELRQYDTAWSALEKKHQQVPSSASNSMSRTNSSQSLGKHRRDSATSDHTTVCAMCERMEGETRTLLKENEELKHRCLDLEIQHERVQNGWVELNRLNKKNEACLKRMQADYTKALADIDYMSAQIKYLKEDHCNLISTRDNLRVSTRRLQSENEALTAKLDDATKTIAALQNEKKMMVTQAQVSENRLSSATTENQQFMATLTQLQAQLQQSEADSRDLRAAQTHVKELEQLLEEAQTQQSLLKLEAHHLRSQLAIALEGAVAKMVQPASTVATAMDQAHHEQQQQQQQVTCSCHSEPAETLATVAPPAAGGAPTEAMTASRTTASPPLMLKSSSMCVVRQPVSTSLRDRALSYDSAASQGLLSSDSSGVDETTGLEDDGEDSDDDAYDGTDDATALAGPLYLGISLIAAATAVRYLVRR